MGLVAGCSRHLATCGCGGESFIANRPLRLVSIYIFSSSHHLDFLVLRGPILMPGVSVLPPTPALAGFGSSRSSQSRNLKNDANLIATDQLYLTGPAMKNGLQSPRSTSEIMSVSDIKEKAKENAHKIARGASALSLIRTARTQTLTAQECELSGDLKGALSAFIKAGTLAQMFMDTAEFKVESGHGKKGVLYKEFQDFTQVSWCADWQYGRCLLMLSSTKEII